MNSEGDEHKPDDWEYTGDDDEGVVDVESRVAKRTGLLELGADEDHEDREDDKDEGAPLWGLVLLELLQVADVVELEFEDGFVSNWQDEWHDVKAFKARAAHSDSDIAWSGGWGGTGVGGRTRRRGVVVGIDADLDILRIITNKEGVGGAVVVLCWVLVHGEEHRIRAGKPIRGLETRAEYTVIIYCDHPPHGIIVAILRLVNQLQTHVVILHWLAVVAPNVF